MTLLSVYLLFDFREKKYSRHQDIKNVILGIFISLHIENKEVDYLLLLDYLLKLCIKDDDMGVILFWRYE